MAESLIKLLPRLSFTYFVGELDMNFQNPKWEEADLRICLTFNGDVRTKAVSGTLSQLTRLVQEGAEKAGKKVFVDFVFAPTADDVEILRENNFPAIFGYNSFQKLEAFDALFCSFSIQFECFELFPLLWSAGIPVFQPDRDKEPSKYPILVGGGVCSQLLEVVNGSKKGCLLDYIYVGEGEDRIPDLVVSLLAHKAELKTDRLRLAKDLVTEFDNIAYCPGYVHVYDGVRLVEIQRRWDWVREEVWFYRCLNKAPHMFERKVLIGDNDSADRVDIQISKGCSGFGSCSFCLEGLEAGPWRQYDKEAIQKAIRESKLWSAPNCGSFFSYNSNYHTDVWDLYYEMVQQLERFSVIALRADTMAAVPDYLGLLKEGGAVRITVALEGISERIRNGILNKNITWDQFFQCVENAFRAGFAVVKSNMIFTGFETEEDIKEFVGAMERLQRLKESMGVHANVLFSTTTLVHYNNTPMQFLPRKSMIREITRTSNELTGYYYELRRLNISARFNRGWTFPFQQMMNDLGRSVTDCLIKKYLAAWGTGKGYSGENFHHECFTEGFASVGLDTIEKIVEYWSTGYAVGQLHPSSTYRIFTDKGWKLIHDRIVSEKPHRACVKTQANLEPVCLGCGACPSAKWAQENLINRDITFKRTLNDVIQRRFANSPKSAFRVVFKIHPQVLARYRLKLQQVHFIASRILRACPELNDAYYALKYPADRYIVDVAEECWYGFSFFEIYTRMSQAELKEKVLSNQESIVGEANKMIKTASIVSFLQSGIEKKSLEWTNIWAFSSPRSQYKLVEAYNAYDGVFKTRNADGVVEEVSVPKEEVGLYLVERGQGTDGIMTLGSRLSPYMAFHSIFRVTHKRLHEVSISRLGAAQEGGGVCRGCNKMAGVSLLTGRPEAFCARCAAAVVAERMKAGK